MTNSKSQKVGGSQAAGPAKCGAQQSKNKKMAAPVCVFENPEFGKVRTLTDDMGEPQFCGKDLCDVLGYKNSSDAIAKHVDGEDLAKREVSTFFFFYNRSIKPSISTHAARNTERSANGSKDGD